MKSFCSILFLLALIGGVGQNRALGNVVFGPDSFLPETSSSYGYRLRAFSNAFERYQAVGEGKKALQLLSDWVKMELLGGHIDRAKRGLETAAPLVTRSGQKMSPDMLLYELAISAYKNDALEMTYNPLMVLDSIKRTDLYRWFGFNYLICEGLTRNGHESSILSATRTLLEMAMQNNYPELFYTARLVVMGLIKKDSALEALSLMQRITREHPPRSLLEERAVSYCYGMIYDRLGQFARAEEFFVRVMRLDAASVATPKSGSIYLSLFFLPAETSIGIGKFYIRWGKFRKAQSCLQWTVNDPLLAGQASDRRTMELLLFHTSQSLFDYRAAMRHHQRYEAFNDSVIQLQRELAVQAPFYRIRSEQQQRRMDTLDLLGQEEKAQLRRTGVERNIIFGGSLILLAASVLILSAYRIKKRNVFQLQLQQSIIHRQNQVQQKLLEEKDRLLQDKDLLMQEIHHRVKNNLNIIISLLESQSHYLDNTAARAALQDTQNRIQAVFLLHQKLYRSAALSEVNVNVYVLELVNYLYETFDLRNRNVVITHQIEPIYLDSHEVLPLAIILNEAVTNALKHAFPDGRKGEIHLTLRQAPAGMIQMQIRDNGVGLPVGYSPAFGKTLGFTLITGLANQLKGYSGIEEDEGVVVTIRFTPRVA